MDPALLKVKVSLLEIYGVLPIAHKGCETKAINQLYMPFLGPPSPDGPHLDR
jgi:hypothetical protein